MHTVLTDRVLLTCTIYSADGGCPALNVDSDVKRESERANALRAVLWMDKHIPNAFIP